MDITGRKRNVEELETRARQQEVVAELGLRALASSCPQSFMDEAVALVAHTLEVEYCKIIELLPEDQELLLRAGVGWEEGLVGNATERVEYDPQAGYTLRSSEPVIVEDLDAETRFGPSPLLREHGVVSGITVAIPGRDGPFGVMGAHSSRRRSFSESDANFLQAVANVLAAAIERKQSEKSLREVREAERSRLARDLHDETFRDLTYSLAEARHVQEIARKSPGEPEPARRLGRLVAALKRVGRQLRSAIYDLRLGGEQDKHFSEQLEHLVELYRPMTPDCAIHLEVGDGALSAPPPRRERPGAFAHHRGGADQRPAPLGGPKSPDRRVGL